MRIATSALILGDLQNDFLHRDGAYGRAGQRDAHVREFGCTVIEDGCATFSDEVTLRSI
jgi:nicotinamidase-related amidase